MLERPVDVLLDQQHADARRVDRRDRLEHLVHHRPAPGPATARPAAAAAAGPSAPGRSRASAARRRSGCPASWPARSASRGNSSCTQARASARWPARAAPVGAEARGCRGRSSAGTPAGPRARSRRRGRRPGGRPARAMSVPSTAIRPAACAVQPGDGVDRASTCRRRSGPTTATSRRPDVEVDRPDERLRVAVDASRSGPQASACLPEVGADDRRVAHDGRRARRRPGSRPGRGPRSASPAG